MPWQLYATLTFAHERSNASADGVLGNYFNDLEKGLRAPVSAFIGKEWDRDNHKRWSGCGIPASAVHFHLLMGSAVPLNADHVEKVWHRFGGRGIKQNSAKVLDYDPHYERHHPEASMNAADSAFQAGSQTAAVLERRL